MNNRVKSILTSCFLGIVLGLIMFAIHVFAAEPDSTWRWIGRDSWPGYGYYFDENGGWKPLPDNVREYPWFKDYQKDVPIWGVDEPWVCPPKDTTSAPITYVISDSCNKLETLHDWVTVEIKVFVQDANATALPIEKRIGKLYPDSSYQDKPLQYCRKCGILRLNLEEEIK